MYKFLGAGVVISIIVFLQTRFADFRNDEMFVGLLSLIAVGLFGVIWRKNSITNSISPIIGIGIFVFIIFFILSDNTLVGSKSMSSIALSFIVAGIFGLVSSQK